MSELVPPGTRSSRRATPIRLVIPDAVPDLSDQSSPADAGGEEQISGHGRTPSTGRRISVDLGRLSRSQDADQDGRLPIGKTPKPMAAGIGPTPRAPTRYQNNDFPEDAGKEFKYRNQTAKVLAVNMKRQGIDQGELDRAIVTKMSEVQQVEAAAAAAAAEAEEAKQTDEEMMAQYKRSIQLAALYVQDALHLRDPKIHWDSKWALRLIGIQLHPAFQWMMLLIVVANMALIGWEPPYASEKSTAGCYGFEFFCIFMYLVELGIEVGHSGWSAFYSTNLFKQVKYQTLGMTPYRRVKVIASGIQWTAMRTALVLIMLFDTFFAAVLPYPYFRITRLCRPLLLLRHPQLRKATKLQLKTSPATAVPLLLIAIMLVLYSIFTTDLAQSIIKDEGGTPGVINDVSSFSTFGNSLVSYMVLLTMDNWPFAWYGMYARHTSYIVLFILFAFVLYYLMLAVVVAVQFDNFRYQRQKQAVRDRVTERRALLRAFQALDTQKVGSVTAEQWGDLLAALNLGEVENRFDLVDVDGSGTVDVYEFFNVCDILLLNIEETKPPPKWITRILVNPRPKLEDFLTKINFNRFIQFILMFDLVIACIYPNLLPTSDAGRTLYAFDALVLAIFIIEICLKVGAFGTIRCFNDLWFRIDLVLIIISFVFTCIPQGGVGTTSINLNALRTVKLLRFTTQSKPLRRFLLTLFGVWVPMVVVLSLISIVTYAYIVVGMELIRDALTTNDAYNSANPFANFSSAEGAFFVMFQLFVLSNWSCIMYATMQSLNWSYSIFFFSYVYSVSIILANLLVSLVLELFYIAREDGDLGRESIPLFERAKAEAKTEEQAPKGDTINPTDDNLDDLEQPGEEEGEEYAPEEEPETKKTFVVRRARDYDRMVAASNSPDQKDTTTNIGMDILAMEAQSAGFDLNVSASMHHSHATDLALTERLQKKRATVGKVSDAKAARDRVLALRKASAGSMSGMSASSTVLAGSESSMASSGKTETNPAAEDTLTDRATTIEDPTDLMATAPDMGPQGAVDPFAAIAATPVAVEDDKPHRVRRGSHVHSGDPLTPPAPLNATVTLVVHKPHAPDSPVTVQKLHRPVHAQIHAPAATPPEGTPVTTPVAAAGAVTTAPIAAGVATTTPPTTRAVDAPAAVATPPTAVEPAHVHVPKRVMHVPIGTPLDSIINRIGFDEDVEIIFDEHNPLAEDDDEEEGEGEDTADSSELSDPAPTHPRLPHNPDVYNAAWSGRSSNPTTALNTRVSSNEYDVQSESPAHGSPLRGRANRL